MIRNTKKDRIRRIVPVMLSAALILTGGIGAVPALAGDWIVPEETEWPQVVPRDVPAGEEGSISDGGLIEDQGAGETLLQPEGIVTDLPRLEETEAETQPSTESWSEETEAEAENRQEETSALETETELEQAKEAAAQTLTVTVTTDRNTRVSKCRLLLKQTKSADGSLSDINLNATLIKEGGSNAKPVFSSEVSGLQPGSIYLLTASMYHFQTSASHTIHVDEDGSLWVDGAADNQLSLTMNCAVYHPRASMTQISLTKLNEIKRGSTGNAPQGAAAAADYFLTVFGRGSGRNDIALLRLEDLSLIRYAQSTVPLNKANDLAFVPSVNKMFVVFKIDSSNTKIIQLQGTSLSYERDIYLNYGYHALAYDEASGCFFALRSGHDGTVCDVYNYGFTQLIRSFDIPTNLTRQGASIYQGRLYYTCYESGSANSYQTVYDGSLNRYDNVIYVYDLYGHLLKTYLLPAPGRAFEVEDIVFLNGRMILQVNDYTSGNARVGYYRVNAQPAFEEFSIPVTQNGKAAKDGAYKATLACNGKTIRTVSSSGGYFSFGAQAVTEPGNYLYTITEKKGKGTANYVYDTAPVSVALSVSYDPYTNRLTLSRQAPSRAQIINAKLSKKQKKSIQTFKASSVSVKKTKARRGGIKITWKKMKFGTKKVEGYEVQVCRSKKFKGDSLQTVRTTKAKAILKGLLRKKKYYVRVRACYTIGVQTYYSRYSSVRRVKTK